MTAFTAAASFQNARSSGQSANAHSALLNGEILLCTQPHSAWGGAVTAQMYLPRARSHVWQEITNYSRWVHFFPDLVQSEVVGKSEGSERTSKRKRLYQVARKAFFLLSVQVEIYLNVIESIQHSTRQQIQFVMEKGSFQDFSADLQLQDYEQGTLLTYSVKATPSIPVPSALVQEAMKLDLPTNMKQMRQVICDAS
ncbi:MAG: SRPBCC family protein [Elainellaceae cyanobacterium]